MDATFPTTFDHDCSYGTGPASPTGHSTITTYRHGTESFDLPTITQRRVLELLLSIPTHKATGDDAISAKLLRIAAPAISPSLSKLLNLCLSTKTFPTAWKVAKVTPVFKGNGMLPILSKILEKHICEYLCNFLTVHMTRNFFISLFERAFKMMKNGVYFIVIALLVAELFKILVYAN